MKRTFLMLLVTTGMAAQGAFGQVEQKLALVDEKLDRLRAEVEALQLQQQKLQESVETLHNQVTELRKQGGNASPEDIARLEARLKAIDDARERDKQVILDTLAKQLAGVPAGGATAAAGGSVHEVKTGETLSTIAKAYGISVDALAKANNLADRNALKVGQKLTIPK